MAQGDTVREIYVLQSGVAEVFHVDGDGVEHPLARVLAANLSERARTFAPSLQAGGHRFDPDTLHA
jgi:CRP-like cAMP-binding protein